jgi:hypothetical protein
MIEETVMAKPNSDETSTLALLNKVCEIDLFSNILRESLEAERAAIQLNKDLLELIRERSLLLKEYEQRMTA